MTSPSGWTVWAVSAAVLALSAAGGPATAASTAPAAAPAQPRAKAGGPESRPVAPAEAGDVEGGRVSRDSGGSVGGWLRTLAALAIVVVLIFAVRWVLRRLAPGARARRLPEAVEVLARTSVSARQQLLLVRLGRRLVLVGCGPEGMSTLSEVTDADEVSALLAGAGGARRDVKPPVRNNRKGGQA